MLSLRRSRERIGCVSFLLLTWAYDCIKSTFMNRVGPFWKIFRMHTSCFLHLFSCFFLKERGGFACTFIRSFTIIRVVIVSSCSLLISIFFELNESINFNVFFRWIFCLPLLQFRIQALHSKVIPYFPPRGGGEDNKRVKWKMICHNFCQ